MRNREALSQAQRAYDNMAPCDNEVDISRIPDDYVYRECPECGERHKVNAEGDCCGIPIEDMDAEVDMEGLKEYAEECRYEARAENYKERS